MDGFSEALSEFGIEPVQFQSDFHKIREFDCVHLFSASDAETWASLRAAVGKIVVTPAMPGAFAPTLSGKGALSNLLRVARALAQRKWPPVDDLSFHAVADFYLVFDVKTQAALASNWHIPLGKILVSGSDYEVAAQAAAEAYVR